MKKALTVIGIVGGVAAVAVAAAIGFAVHASGFLFDDYYNWRD